MSQPDWRPFLERFGREMLTDEGIRASLPPDVVASGWLGFAPAAGKDLAKLERRLRRRLPGSYRDFLLVTNGWRNVGPFIPDLRPAADVAWFRKENQDWIDSYLEESEDQPPLPLKDHLVYGPAQDCCRFRVQFLPSALQISGVGDSAVCLLNPEVKTPQGEWEAWFFANWLPGAHRYPSFRELLEALLDQFIQLRDKKT